MLSPTLLPGSYPTDSWAPPAPINCASTSKLLSSTGLSPASNERFLPRYFQGLTQQMPWPITLLCSTGAHQLLATPSPRSADVPPRPNFFHQLVCPLLRKGSPQLCPQLCRSFLGRGVSFHIPSNTVLSYNFLISRVDERNTQCPFLSIFFDHRLRGSVLS